jgi:hypothetical protein
VKGAGEKRSLRKHVYTYILYFLCSFNDALISSDYIASMSPSEWPRGLKHEPSSPARILGLWVRIPLEAWMSVCVYSVYR